MTAPSAQGSAPGGGRSSGGPAGWPAHLLLLTGLSVGAVVAVNAAGIWGIAVPRP